MCMCLSGHIMGDNYSQWFIVCIYYTVYIYHTVFRCINLCTVVRKDSNLILTELTRL